MHHAPKTSVAEPLSPLYDVTAFTPQENRHAPYIYTGLFELEHRGIIKLNIRLAVHSGRDRYEVSDSGGKLTNQLYPWATIYHVKDRRTGRRAKFAVDLQDWGRWFSYRTLQ